LKQEWCIPEVSTDYVAAMEDVLDLYAEPPDPNRPKVCFDETPKQLIAETRQPLPARPGQPERYDYEYRRNGTCNLFMFLDPDAGWRHVSVTAQRTKRDFAHQMKWLADERYPDAERIRVVLDNLNTHRPAALYEAFPPDEARRILRRLEFHYTPKHGSWLNMAELEISVFDRQCWDRRIGDQDTLQRETQALEGQRNAVHATVQWRFTCRDARTRMRGVYPSVSA
jgi:DDE superfamily endonuclease